ncbi:MAG: winged helix-turn-helix transcriptional regulator [Burkholderiaceae bacterium]|nr:winged helix-turn-helix transcriptional regulator [Roseateles sp.]MBV8468703.1 winged helix-turn-helix transcriptional regulator [Burkholderiaceae bacterium]
MSSKSTEAHAGVLPGQGPRGCTNFKLRQLTRLVSQHCEQYFNETGLKTTQYSLLSHIDLLGPVQPSDLALRMDVDVSTLSRNVQVLMGLGLVEMCAGDDARSRRLVLTEQGRAKRAAMKANWKRAQTSLNAKLDDERVARLHAVLDECLALMRED